MKIVVLAGGTSTERDVSFVTGSMVYKALKQKGHQVILLDVYYGYSAEDSENIADLFESEHDFSADIGKIGGKDPDIEKVKSMRPDSPHHYFGPHVIELCQLADIVFLALHGENGENGKIQAAFDLLGIRYTGSDYLSSALAMNKCLSKTVFRQYHIATPDYLIVPAKSSELPETEFPCVVKTACGGSSVGVYIANDRAEYEKAVKDAKAYGADIVVESYIKGREFSVGVVDGKAYPVIEIAPIEGFYDYKNKYQAGSTVETCPADLSDEIATAMQECAEDAYHALGMSAYARMDFMMNEKGEFFCLEANTLPGMTPTSLLPQEAAAIGIDFPDLCEKLIDVSLKKYEV